MNINCYRISCCIIYWCFMKWTLWIYHECDQMTEWAIMKSNNDNKWSHMNDWMINGEKIHLLSVFMLCAFTQSISVSDIIGYINSDMDSRSTFRTYQEERIGGSRSHTQQKHIHYLQSLSAFASWLVLIPCLSTALFFGLQVCIFSSVVHVTVSPQES